MLNDKRLAEIKARCAAATPGPWWWDLENPVALVTGEGNSEQEIARMEVDVPPAMVDTDFIQYARTDLPDLVVEVERQRDEIATATATADRLLRESLEAHAEIGRLREALSEIAKGAGPFRCPETAGLSASLTLAGERSCMTSRMILSRR